MVPSGHSALRALHGDDGEPIVVPTTLIGWGGPRCFSTAQTAQDYDAQNWTDSGPTPQF